MNFTECRPGATIAALRRAKGMTQEQLAAALGVSAPAVSKWETDTTCPDVALLCPLARALGTNVDTLLQFEESIPEKEVVRRIGGILEAARIQGLPQAEGLLEDLLRLYPSSTSVKYYAAVVEESLAVLLPSSPAEDGERRKTRSAELLEAVCADRSSPHWQDAVCSLALAAIRQDETGRAEALLRELPQRNAAPTAAWAQLHLKRGDPGKAKEVLQRRLLSLVSQVQLCLAQLMSEAVEPDPEQALQIGEVCRQIEELFPYGAGMSAGLLTDLYQRLGQPHEAAESLLAWVEALTDPPQPPAPLLFSAAAAPKPGQSDPFREIRRMLLRELTASSAFAPLQGEALFQAALRKLEDSLAESA